MDNSYWLFIGYLVGSGIGLVISYFIITIFIKDIPK